MQNTRAFTTLALLVALAPAQGIRIGPEPAPPTQQEQPQPPGATLRDGRHRPPHHGPRVCLTDMKVTVTVVDGAATVEVRQTLRNEGNQVAEADWIQPIPPGAVADKFTMTVCGQEMAGEVLDGPKARAIYDDIVRRRRDPGLLEYAGHGCLRARIFPIEPNAEIPVVVRYRQLLPLSGTLHTLAVPLRAAGHTFGIPRSLVIDATIRSRTPLKSIWTPLPGADVSRRNDHEARISLERRGQQIEQDLQIFYGVSDKDFGLDVLTWAKANQPGYFLLLLAPRHEWPQLQQPKRITFVTDTSGSMKGEKMQQARAALKFFVESLQPHDLFDVVPFSTEARPFFPAAVPASAENRARALELANGLEAQGGTNIEDALVKAMELAAGATGGEVPITVFLTDGLPTVGTTDIDTLLAQATQRNTSKSRVFVFGVGNDVNTRLLDSLADRTRGDRDYVREQESIEHKTGVLFEKLAHPVLTDVELRIDDIEGFDVLPKTTPDLFKGSRLVVVGRYRGAGNKAVRLRGNFDGKPREYVFEASFPADQQTHDFVPSLWAQKRIAFLLDQIRLNGQRTELVEEVTRLGKQYGIVTPFTSHLIVEEGMRVARAAGRGGSEERFFGASVRDREALGEELRRAGVPAAEAEAPAAPEAAKKLDDERVEAKARLARLRQQDTGAGAVDNSILLLDMARAAPGSVTATGAVANLLSRRVKERTFYLAGDVWIDGAMRSELLPAIEKIPAFSEAYFALLTAHPDLAPYLAFSTRLILVVDGRAIEITPPAE